MTFPVSILDQSPIIGDASPRQAINATLELARLADRRGYHRYWLAEHHGLIGLADASPEILLARIGAETKAIRIGTGGVMLPYYSSYKVAEQFRMLEALYPGRVDLGVGRAPGGHMRTARAIADGQPVDADDGFIRKLAELSALFKGKLPDGHQLKGLTVNPAVETAPELWVLGSSSGGALMASQLGMRYAFAHFINAHGGPEVARAYRQRFEAWHEEKPHVAVAVIAVCAPTAGEVEGIRKAMALRWVYNAYGRNERVPTVAEAAAVEFSAQDKQIAERELARGIIGTTDDVARRVIEVRDAFEADEVILVSMAPSYELRTFTAERMAEALELKPRA